MEAKDLFLLMIIPIILIGLIIYTDKAPAITGAVIDEQKESNIIGTYSVMPSFKAKIDYNLDDYKILKEKLSNVVDECISREDVEQCFNDKSAELNWNCEEGDETNSVLYDFLDKLRECASLQEQNVVCRFALDKRKLLATPRPQRIFEIRLTDELHRIKAEQIEYDKVLSVAYADLSKLVYTGYNNRNDAGIDADIIKIRIVYTNGVPSIEEAFAIKEESKRIDLSKIFLLYKTKKDVKFVDVAEEGSFRAPTPANKIIDLPQKKGFKFCAKSGKQFYAYDSSDNTVKLRDIVYKFAVAYPNPPTPPPIKSLKAEDKLKAEKSIVLKWGKVKLDNGNDVEDFSHYNIYCSKNPLQDKNTKEIKLEFLKPAIAVKSNINYDTWVVDIDKCGNDNIQDNIDYYFAVTAVSKAKKESKAVVQSSTKSIDDLAPGTQIIVLTNSKGNKQEGTSIACIELPSGDSDKPGSIIAGFFRPIKNEDELTILQETEPVTYYLHFSRQNAATSNLDECNALKCIQLAFAPGEQISTQDIKKRTFTKFSDIEDKENNNKFKEGEKYCFTVVAKDINNNLIKSLNIPYKFVKPQQWLDMESKPVIKGFFNDKGDINYS